MKKKKKRSTDVDEDMVHTYKQTVLKYPNFTFLLQYTYNLIFGKQGVSVYTSR